MQNTWMPTIVGSVIMVVAYPVYAWAGKTHGGMGLALVSSCAISLYVVILGTLLRRRIAGPESPRIVDMVLPMLVAVALGIAAGEGLEHLLPSMPVLLNGTLVGLTATFVCLLVAWLLKVREVAEVASMLRRKLG
jgi:peptidoglycan biosynthesis protein MviN/MurJ (putative lipid II flippase)